MNNTYIFLRHADSLKDPSVNAAEWILSEQGEKEARDIAAEDVFKNIDYIFVSEEVKTELTARHIAKDNNIQTEKMAEFNEVKRGDKFLSKEDFQKEKDMQLTDLAYKAFDGESGYDALSRFKKGISYLDEKYTGKKIVVVSHGTVLNMYFADILGKESELPVRWSKTGFCSYGVVEGSDVVKDIIG